MDNKKIYLYGAGETGKRWLEKLGREKIEAFIDSREDLWNTEQLGKRILSLKDVANDKSKVSIFVSTGKQYAEEIRGILKVQGFEDCIIYNPYDEDVLRCDRNVFLDPLNTFEGHNYLASEVMISNVHLGFGSYISERSEISNTFIGRYCSVGPSVKVITGQHPTTKFVSTHPAFFSPNNIVSDLKYVKNAKYDEYRFAKDAYSVVIGNDVWIGANVLMMEGITIGDGAIIAAGSIVTKDVSPYSVVGGVPAKEIKKRFTSDQIDYLLRLQWWNKSECWIRNHAEWFDDIDNFIQQVSMEDEEKSVKE